ncbi:hypothetical protein DSLASN_09970 [Desulfoluna limicola]|uniref:Uncharacterized protein n=1 Tax=Desulfoluna limicola TaxID=2810562 RepID=A0ABM7PDW4_9BACT|nr:hypothetical protein DSLASN_09970 [Desulfoluna limicola]
MLARVLDGCKRVFPQLPTCGKEVAGHAKATGDSFDACVAETAESHALNKAIRLKSPPAALPGAKLLPDLKGLGLTNRSLETIMGKPKTKANVF